MTCTLECINLTFANCHFQQQLMLLHKYLTYYAQCLQASVMFKIMPALLMQLISAILLYSLFN